MALHESLKNMQIYSERCFFFLIREKIFKNFGQIMAKKNFWSLFWSVIYFHMKPKKKKMEKRTGDADMKDKTFFFFTFAHW